MIRFLFVLFMLFVVLVQSSDKNIEPKSLVLSLIKKSPEIDSSKNNLLSSSNFRDDASVSSDSLPKTSITDSVLTKRASSIDLFGLEKKKQKFMSSTQIDKLLTDFYKQHGGDQGIGSYIYKIQCYFYQNPPKGKKDFYNQANTMYSQHLNLKKIEDNNLLIKKQELKRESYRQFVERIVSYDTPEESERWKASLARKLARKQGLDVQKGFTDDDATDHSDIES
ncbi:MAG: hypothetical protein ACXWL5_04550 [Candidatus Chromulinivorax sp.]